FSWLIYGQPSFPYNVIVPDRSNASRNRKAAGWPVAIRAEKWHPNTLGPGSALTASPRLSGMRKPTDCLNSNSQTADGRSIASPGLEPNLRRAAPGCFAKWGIGAQKLGRYNPGFARIRDRPNDRRGDCP